MSVLKAVHSVQVVSDLSAVLSTTTKTGLIFAAACLATYAVGYVDIRSDRIELNRLQALDTAEKPPLDSLGEIYQEIPGVESDYLPQVKSWLGYSFGLAMYLEFINGGLKPPQKDNATIKRSMARAWSLAQAMNAYYTQLRRLDLSARNGMSFEDLSPDRLIDLDLATRQSLPSTGVQFAHDTAGVAITSLTAALRAPASAGSSSNEQFTPANFARGLLSLFERDKNIAPLSDLSTALVVDDPFAFGKLDQYQWPTKRQLDDFSSYVTRLKSYGSIRAYEAHEAQLQSRVEEWENGTKFSIPVLDVEIPSTLLGVVGALLSLYLSYQYLRARSALAKCLRELRKVPDAGPFVDDIASAYRVSQHGVPLLRLRVAFDLVSPALAATLIAVCAASLQSGSAIYAATIALIASLTGMFLLARLAGDDLASDA